MRRKENRMNMGVIGNGACHALRMATKPARENVLDLQSGLLERSDPAAIATGLKRAAQRTTKRDAYRAAMSMVDVYIRRQGNKLSKRRRRTLEEAKAQLRIQFHRPAQ